jgi:hypothetical protein
MKHLAYNSLASKVRSTDPYRGTMRYPMENRSNRQNIFELVETDKDIEFHVAHGYRYKEVEISEARHKMLEGVRGAKVFKKEHDHQQFDFFTMDISPRTLCVVRSDNSLEYVNHSFYQGDNMKMSDWMGGYQYDSYRMSGTAYCERGYANLNHPVFHGLRIDLETHQPVNQNVQVFRRAVNRKKSKELMMSYKEAFKSPDALLRCMDVETMLVSAKDILDEHEAKINEGGLRNYIGNTEYFKLAEQALADKANFDAVVLYAMSLQLDGFNHWAMDNWRNNQQRSYHRMTEPRNLVTRLVTNLSKRLYKEHKPFDEEEVDFKTVTPSQWGLRIMVDGVEVKL